MPIDRWMASAAGGTSQRLKPGAAIVRCLSSTEGRYRADSVMGPDYAPFQAIAWPLQPIGWLLIDAHPLEDVAACRTVRDWFLNLPTSNDEHPARSLTGNPGAAATCHLGAACHA